MSSAVVERGAGSTQQTGEMSGTAKPWGSLLDAFSRVTSSGRFVPEIDGLRFLAILGVFLYHLEGFVRVRGPTTPLADSRPLVSLVEQGHYGVQLFFLISGFILALPFANQHLRGAPAVGLGPYFWRRLTRLEPPYVLSMVAMYLLLVVVNHVGAITLLGNLAASCVYLHNVVFLQPSRINGVAWSLEIEVQFYVLVPLLTRVFALRSATARRGLLVVAMIGLALYQRATFDPVVPTLPQMSILFFLQYFLAGFLLADVYVCEWNEKPTRGAGGDVLAIASIVGLALVCVRDWEPRLLFPFLALTLAMGVFRGRWSSRILSLRPITTIGGMCYSIYLLHYPLIAAFGRLSLRAWWSQASYAINFAIQVLIVGLGVVAVSAAYFLAIEKPCMRRDWPRRLRNSVTRWLGAAPSLEKS